MTDSVRAVSALVCLVCSVCNGEDDLTTGRSDRGGGQESAARTLTDFVRKDILRCVCASIVYVC